MSELLKTLPKELQYYIFAKVIPLDFAAKKNMVFVFKSIDNTISKKQSKRAWYGAIKYGRRQILKILVEKKIKPPGEISNYAAKFSNMDILYYVMSNVGRIKKYNHRIINEIQHCIKYDRLDNFIFLISLTYKSYTPNKLEDLNLINLISSHKSCKILKWIISNIDYIFEVNDTRKIYMKWIKEILMNETVRLGDREDIMYFLSNEIINPYAIEIAASRGMLDIVIELFPYRNDNHFLINATIGGHLYILIYFKELIKCSTLIFPSVLLQHIPIVEWLFITFPTEIYIPDEMYSTTLHTKNKELIKLCENIRSKNK